MGNRYCYSDSFRSGYDRSGSCRSESNAPSCRTKKASKYCGYHHKKWCDSYSKKEDQKKRCGDDEKPKKCYKPKYWECQRPKQQVCSNNQLPEPRSAPPVVEKKTHEEPEKPTPSYSCPNSEYSFSNPDIARLVCVINKVNNSKIQSALDTVSTKMLAEISRSIP